jgi:hypothetical protein
MEENMAKGRPLLRAHHKTDGPRTTSLPPNNPDYIQDWTTLAPGEWVFIVDNDAPELSGRVDTVTDDGQILWLHLEAGAGRRLFTRTEGVLSWRVPENRVSSVKPLPTEGGAAGLPRHPAQDRQQGHRPRIKNFTS